MNTVATNDVTVTNNVNVNSNTSGGNSSSHTSITTTTNGETFHLESNESGEIHVETKNGETTVKTSPGMKVNISQGNAKVDDNLSSKSTHATTSAKEVLKKIKERKREIKLNVWQHLENTLKKLFEKFKI